MSTRHAPKGRIKGTLALGTPMEGQQPMERVTCTAKSKQSQQRCRKPPIPGGSVCHMHGGNIPAVRQKAAERLLALQSPAIDTLAFLMKQRAVFPSTAYAAARDVLDRTEGKAVDRVEQKVDGKLVIRVEKPW